MLRRSSHGRLEPEFEARWDAHPVDEKRRGSKLLTHPEVGDLAIAYEVLDLGDDTGQQLITWLPADDVTAARLAISPARPDSASSKAPELPHPSIGGRPSSRCGSVPLPLLGWPRILGWDLVGGRALR